jgi:hypothetical protein
MTAVWRAARGLPVPEAARLLFVQNADSWVATNADPGSSRVRRDNCYRNWTQAHASGYSGK